MPKEYPAPNLKRTGTAHSGHAVPTLFFHFLALIPFAHSALASPDELSLQPPGLAPTASVLAERPAPVRLLSGRTDNEDTTTSLSFYSTVSNLLPSTAIGGGWRHDYDLTLTRAARDLVIYDELGNRRLFPAAANLLNTDLPQQAYEGQNAADGSLRAVHGQVIWHRANGDHITFQGSQPIRQEPGDGAGTSLHYYAGRLQLARRDDGAVTRFEYLGDQLTTVTLADGTRHGVAVSANGNLNTRRLAQAQECRPEDPSPQTIDASDERETEPCDTVAHPPGTAFTSTAGIAGAIRIDARPHSCRSYFVDFYGTERGTAIEQGFDALPHYSGYTPTVANFPIVDFIGDELRVIRSRDLSLPSYNELRDGLYERLLRDGRDIDEGLLAPLAQTGSVSASLLGDTTTLDAEPARVVVFELVVRHGFASPDQEDQIRRAAEELQDRYGIVLRVIEIP